MKREGINIHSERPTSHNFTASIEKLTEQTTQENPDLEEQARALAENVGAKSSVELSALSVRDIRKRLNMSPERAARIGEYENSRLNASRYLREFGGNISSGHEALLAVAQNLSDEENDSPLTAAQKEEAERFLLGDEVYERRMGRLHKRHGNSIPDDIRQRTIQNAFTALQKQGSREVDESALWRDRVGPVQKLQERVHEQLTFSAHMPVRELAEFIAKEGSDSFLHDLAVGKSEKPLSELLNLDEHKAMLDALPADATAEQRSETYLAIVHKISKTLKEEFPYKSTANNLRQMRKDAQANCAGYTLLGSLALKELHIPSAYVGGTGHAFVALSTPDGKLYFNHFQGKPSALVSEDDLDRISVSSLTDYIEDPSQQIKVVKLSIDSPLAWWREGKEKSLNPQESLYMYKGMDPALISWINNEIEERMDAEALFSPKEIIDPRMIDSGRKAFVRLVERSPDDPAALLELALREKNVFGKHTATARWSDLLDSAETSKEGKRRRSVWTKLRSMFFPKRK